MNKQSYMENDGKKVDPDPIEKGTSQKDQENVKRNDPGLKKGYNEKNPSEPQGSFTPESQADEPKQVQEGDESK